MTRKAPLPLWEKGRTKETLMSTLMRIVLGVVLLVGSAGDGRAVGQETESKPAEEQLDEFVPSEEISAGSDVSFPVDI